MYQLFPSLGWDVYVRLQVMQQSSLYASNETMLTLFYEDRRLYQVPVRGYGETGGGGGGGGGVRGRRAADTSSSGPAFPLQLVYLVNNQQGQLIKRLLPVEQLLMYQQLNSHHSLQQQK